MTTTHDRLRFLLVAAALTTLASLLWFAPSCRGADDPWSRVPGDPWRSVTVKIEAIVGPASSTSGPDAPPAAGSVPLAPSKPLPPAPRTMPEPKGRAVPGAWKKIRGPSDVGSGQTCQLYQWTNGGQWMQEIHDARGLVGRWYYDPEKRWAANLDYVRPHDEVRDNSFIAPAAPPLCPGGKCVPGQRSRTGG